MAQKHNTISANDLFLVFLALLLVGTSFWQTWIGLDQIFGKASFAIALVLALLLLFFCWLIRQAKLEGRSTTGLVWTYMFIASFCFIANFNAIYTRFMRKGIYIEEMIRVRDTFPVMSSAVDAKLSYAVTDPNLRREVLTLTSQLKLQIRDPKNQGIGPEAQKIIHDIERKLGKKLTPLTPVSQDPEGYEDLANRMEAQVLALVESLTPAEDALKTKIATVSAEQTQELQKSIDKIDDVIAKDGAYKVIGTAIAAYNDLGNNAQTTLGAEKYEHEKLETDSHEVGKISYTFRHAFSEFGITTLLVLAGCILLDFVLVIVVLQTTPNTDARGRSSASGYRNAGNTRI